MLALPTRVRGLDSGKNLVEARLESSGRQQLEVHGRLVSSRLGLCDGVRVVVVHRGTRGARIAICKLPEGGRPKIDD